MSTTESAGSNFSGMFASIGGVAANFLQDKMLKKMDTDSSGAVSSTEFKATLEQVGTKLGVDTGDSSTADEMFASVDTNGDGELIGSEVGQMLKNMFAPQPDTGSFLHSRGSEQQFAELDADGDGTISMAEFGIASTSTDSDTLTTDTASTESLSGESLQSLLTEVDSDSDGQISNSELTAYATKLSSQLQAASTSYNTMASFTTT